MPTPLKFPQTASEQFEGNGKLSPSELLQKREDYVDALTKSQDVSVSKEQWLSRQPHATGQSFDVVAAGSRAATPMDAMLASLQTPEIAKSMSPESLQSIQQALANAQIPDLTKDLTNTSPLSTGYVMFDLEQGAKMLTPKPTPLRNTITRRPGMGLAHRFKRITGFTGTGTGGVGITRAGIQDNTQTNFAPAGGGQSLYFARGPKISYAGDEFVVPYVQFGVSDQVPWSAQYAGRGFQDIRALSKNALIWSSMLIEERTLLYGRGTAAGFSGVLAAPTGAAGVARSTTGSEVGLSGITSSLIYVRVVAEMGDFGVSQATAATAGISATNGQVVDVTYTLPAGATGARVFVSTGAADPGDAARWLYVGAGSATSPTPGGRSGYNKLTLQGALPTSGVVPTAWPLTAAGGGTANLTSGDGGSAVANEYDGILAYCTGANAGYTTKLNGTFSNVNPGIEYQNAFVSMYEAVKADPDRILMAGRDRKQLSDTIKGASNSNYGIRLMQDNVNGVTLGSIAVGIFNEVTGSEVDIQVHPWLPQGNSLILSDRLPIPDTEVDSVFAVYNVQDLMGIDWPVNQFAFESSSYWYGTLVCYAPAWLGSITGIQAV